MCVLVILLFIVLQVPFDRNLINVDLLTKPEVCCLFIAISFRYFSLRIEIEDTLNSIPRIYFCIKYQIPNSILEFPLKTELQIAT